MLTTIKSLVDAPSIPFGEYYINYVMRVQDQNINKELKSMLHNNKTDVRSMDILIENTYKSIKKE